MLKTDRPSFSVSHLTLEYPSLGSCILFWLQCLEVSFSFCLSINFVFICFIYILYPVLYCFVSLCKFNLLPCLLNLFTFISSPFFLCTSCSPIVYSSRYLDSKFCLLFVILMYIAYTMSLKLR